MSPLNYALPGRSLVPAALALSLLLLLSANAAYAQMHLEVAFSGLTFNSPVDLQSPRDGTNRIFVVERDGMIWVFANDPGTTEKSVFLNITDRVNSLGPEEGLLGLAFHPDYADSGYFYVNYTADGPPRTVVARYSVTANPDSAARNTERLVLEVPQPFANHNGGQLAFGPDRYLYIGMGDGGSANDPSGNGQNRQTLLGSLLRIDPDTTTATTAYGIPPDNPFVGNAQGFREEIYAWGLRNPWRFSFDPPTGQLWLGDVGQGLWEEVDIVVKGGNYGWDTMEGFHCFEPAVGCDMTGLTLPVWEYDHNAGRAITGGYVYRGTRIPSLVGKYIYADYSNGVVWSLDYDGINPPANVELIDTTLALPSFGIDSNDELYICAFDGRIYQFEAPGVPVALQGFRSYWTGRLVEVSWTLYDVSEGVAFEIYRARGEGALDSIDSKGVVAQDGGAFVFQDGTTSPGTTYRYRVIILENGQAVTSFETSTSTPAAALLLEQNRPNPFNPTTVIPFVLDRRDHVQLAIFDTAGRRVAELLDRELDAGPHAHSWDGRDASGNPVASGLYFYRLRAGNRTLTRKAVLLK